ncbi:MAG TPA: FkbM family methyltransferase [Stellaceae bacterium]|nr:FkbM family methyltransferase [Stellaceae bacterium]
MSHRIASTLAALVRAGTCYLKPTRRTIARAAVCEMLAPEIVVPVPEGALHFLCPNPRAAHDPSHLYLAEPETIRWIDALPDGAVLWDIGAGVGTYALYAARHRGARVLAFEPSAATYAVLCENVRRNGLSRLVDAYNLALAGESRLDHLFMAHAEAGQSMHAFGQRDTIATRLDAPLTQAVLGLSIDDFVARFSPPPPSHVKLDVDSIEEAILKGGAQTLARHTQGILVEIDGAARAAGGKAIIDALAAAGFAEDKAFARAGDTRNVLFRRG